MDREAAVIRAEMSRTRAAIDRKLTLLESRAREMSPRRVWKRHKPPFLVDQALGGLLVVAGLVLAFNRYRALTDRRMRLRQAIHPGRDWRR